MSPRSIVPLIAAMLLLTSWAAMLHEPQVSVFETTVGHAGGAEPAEGTLTDNGDGLLALHPFRERYQYVYVRDDGRDDGARSRRQGGRLWRRGLRRLPDQIAR